MDVLWFIGGVVLVVGTYLAVQAWRTHVPDGWIIGPLIDGKNLSYLMPMRPLIRGTGWFVGIPPFAHMHYATKNGQVKRHITIRYKVEGLITCRERPDLPASMSFHFQREGDNWSARGKYETYRWYSKQELPLTPGEHVAHINLNHDEWINVQGPDTTEQFEDAVKHMARVGIVFGSAGGRGHGVLGPATFELLDWSAE